MKMEQTDSVPKRWHIKFRCCGITQKKGYNANRYVGMEIFTMGKYHIYPNMMAPPLESPFFRNIPIYNWLAGGCVVWRLNHDGAEIFCAVQTHPEARLASCRVGTVSFLGDKWLDHGADHVPLSSASLRMASSHTSALTLCLNRHVMGWPLPLPYLYI